MIKKIKEYFHCLQPLEFLVIVFYVAIILAIFTQASAIAFWFVYVLVDIGVIAGLAHLCKVQKSNHSILLKFIRYWYAGPLILLTFKQIYFLIAPIRGVGDYDFLLIAIDKAILGVNPTYVLKNIANPILTEVLQMCYMSFYFLPMVLGYSLYKEKKMLQTEYVIFATVYGFFISYLGYFLLPAVGPRFTLHNFATNDTELPGLFVTQFLRFVINTGESIPPGTLNPIAHVQRDVFPSGHTMMTAMVMYMAFKYKAKTRFGLLIVGMLLIFATIYLRYHYLTDVLTGLLFTAFALWSGVYVFNYFKKILGKPERI
ncbi:MAG: phosphatase PAP2 family protein [Ignavibacteria bacterium]|nr:phosphatase PAP2 family protein [Ignavibacteria bacterium]